MESVEITGTTRCSFMYALLSLSVKPSRYLPQRDRARMALRLPFQAALWLRLTKAAESVPGRCCSRSRTAPAPGQENAHPSGEPRPGCTRGLPERGNTASSRAARGQPAPGRSPPARRGRGKRSAGSARRAQPSPAGARGRPGWVPAASGHPPALAPPQALRARAAGRGARRENGRCPLSPEGSRCGRAGGSPAPLPVTFKRVYV